MARMMGLVFSFGILVSTVSFAQDYYCHTDLWGGELTFQNTSSDLQTLANDVVDQCKNSIGAAEADSCVANLTCDLVDAQGKFQSAVDTKTIIIK